MGRDGDDLVVSLVSEAQFVAGQHHEPEDNTVRVPDFPLLMEDIAEMLFAPGSQFVPKIEHDMILVESCTQGK
ncbi:hypothetical protein Nepgr_010482 [Nepenthes gracilis]|uniref:Uncharacterized protein n=1 Tax=Nepenthes gracilis TaxID=150966 RepID=A0AAD3SDI2_NEPGR|nr:hypothetical protein Nepgr_010482 [Nepenthes gracilis]